MEFQFPWPYTTGEWVSFGSAAITIVFGLMLFIMPRISLRILRLQTVPGHPEALSEARGTMAGFYLGVGLMAILLAQPLIYLALGVSWGFTAFGRLVSILSDKGNTLFNWISLLFEIALAFAAIAYPLGFL